MVYTVSYASVFMVALIVDLFPSPPGDSPNPSSPSAPPEELPPPMELSIRDITALLQESNLKTLMATHPLDLGYDILCDSETYQVGEGEEGGGRGEGISVS